MRYISVCSGIEAASVAWQPLGWEAVAFAEIEAFPNAVLAYRFPDVPNLGDISKVDWSKYHGTVDLVVGGTPCQSFSVAGKREGMDGASGLVNEYFRLLSEVRPKLFLWENVPGVFSSGEWQDFPQLLREWAKLGYHVAWRVLDAQFFGVPQRRRRVFALGCLGGWQYPAKVLFESHSLCRHPAPRRKAREADPGTAERGANQAGIAKCLTARNERYGWETENIICSQYGDKAGALRARYDSSPCADNGQNIVFSIADNTIDRQLQNGGNGAGFLEDVSYTLNTIDRHAVAECYPINTMVATRHMADDGRTCLGIGEDGDPQFTLSSAHEHAVYCRQAPLVFKDREGKPGGGKGILIGEDKSFTLSCNQDQSLFNKAAVRRLTPTECERLQGFPDGWTDIPYKGKPAPDGARYKALGNSMCVNVMRWIGKRIQMVEEGKL